VVVMYAGVVVEMASVRELYRKPLHPYTMGLLGSIPKLGARKTAEDGSRAFLNIIAGTLPDPRNFPTGCRFAPRCPRVMKRCWESEPRLLGVESGRQVRCYLYEMGGAGG